MRARRFWRLRYIGVAFLALFLTTSLAQGQTAPTRSRAQIKSSAKRPVIGPSAAEVAALRSRAAPGPANVLTVPKAAGNRQVSKNQSPGDALRTGASETTVAANNQADKIVVGWNDGEGFAFAPFGPPPALGLSGFGYSCNGGGAWTDGGAPPIGNVVAFGPGTAGRSATGNYVTRGDPWLDFSGNTYFYANLAVWEDDPLVPPAGLSLHKGAFTGCSFAWNSAVLVQSPNYPDDFLDKEAMAVTGARVDITVTNFIEVCNIPFFAFGQIELYRSSDGGTTWSRTIVHPDETFITDPNNPACGLDGVVNQGSAPAVAANGTLYVAWERGWFAPLAGGSALPRATIAFRSVSPSGAVSPMVTIKSVCSAALDPARPDGFGGPAGYNRTSSQEFPRIAVAKAGPFAGRIYVAFQDCTPAYGPAAPFGSDSDAHIAFSDDGGATWTVMPVHATADGKIQFWPVPSINGSAVDVVYYESREVNVTPDPTDDECVVRIGGPLNDPDLKTSKVSSLVDLMRVRSTDGGSTWGTPVKVTTQTTNWCAATPINSIIPNFGDYNDHRAIGPRRHTVWADGRNGTFVDHIPTTWYANNR